jgi:hypothetical protein
LDPSQPLAGENLLIAAKSTADTATAGTSAAARDITKTLL